MTVGVDRDEAELRELARLHVRAGLRSSDEVAAAMVRAIEVQMPGTDPRIMARAWVVAAERELVAEATGWTAPTDHDRFTAALAECREHDVAVLEGVDDLQRVRAAVEESPTPLRGVLWFGEQAVWHAVVHGSLELELRHGNGIPATCEDPLTVAVLKCLDRHGVDARWHEGRVEARLRWQRRPRG